MADNTIPVPKKPVDPNNPTKAEIEYAKRQLALYEKSQTLYKKGSDYYNQNLKIITDLQAIIKAGETKAKNVETKKKDKSIKSQADDLQTKIDIAKAKGQDTKDLEAKKKKLEEGLSTNVEPDYVGTGTKDKPLTFKGKAYTGTYEGKDYKDGILVVKSASDNKSKNTSGNNGKKDTGTKDDIKGLWVSYLRSTFAGLEDKTQKAQIDRILDQAVTQQWDESTFLEALQGTVWWQTTLPSMRQFFLDTHDPRNASTFAEKLKNNIAKLTGKLENLGIQIQKIDPSTGKLIDNSDLLQGVAMEAIKNNWTDSQIDDYLAKQGNIVFTGGGTLGSYYDKIYQQAYLYGVKLDDTMKANINMSLLDPNDGRDAQYWLTAVKDMAYDAPENKAFLPALKAGRNLYEVTNSYRQQMAQLLEVDPTAITWNDLMGKVVDNSTGNARTFADFNKQLKQDPLWQYTKNAKETYSNMALDIAKMFGFAG